MLKRQIKIKLTENDKAIKVYIKPESYDIMRKLRVVKAQEYHYLIKQGVATRAAMLDLLKKEGYWTDREEEQLSELIVKISLLEQSLEEVKESDKQRDIVLNLMRLRNKLLELMQIKTEPLESVAETISEDIERENYLVESTFYEDGKKYFSSYADFKSRREEANVQKVYTMFLKALQLNSTNILLDLPEHKWLIEHNLMNKEGDLLDQELVAQLNDVVTLEVPVVVKQEEVK